MESSRFQSTQRIYKTFRFSIDGSQSWENCLFRPWRPHNWTYSIENRTKEQEPYFLQVFISASMIFSVMSFVCQWRTKNKFHFWSKTQWKCYKIQSIRSLQLYEIVKFRRQWSKSSQIKLFFFLFKGKLRRFSRIWLWRNQRFTQKSI